MIMDLMSTKIAKQKKQAQQELINAIEELSDYQDCVQILPLHWVKLKRKFGLD